MYVVLSLTHSRAAVTVVRKDKSSCVGVHSVRRLMADGDDVIHVNVGSGITTAHMASLTHGSETVIYAFGIQSDRQQQQINHNLQRFGCRCILPIFTFDLHILAAICVHISHRTLCRPRLCALRPNANNTPLNISDYRVRSRVQIPGPGHKSANQAVQFPVREILGPPML